MSLHMAKGMARLTVLGAGWSNAAIESGDGFTLEGEMLKDLAEEFGFDIGDDVDWDLISENDFPDVDWSEAIYTDDLGNIYTDDDKDGVWKDPNTGFEYSGGGKAWLPENTMASIADKLHSIADEDSQYARYNIPQDVLNSIKGGPISSEQQSPSAFGDNGPHYYRPFAYVIQWRQTLSYVFNSEIIEHGSAKGDVYNIDTTTIVIRDGSSKTVYYGACNTHNFDPIVPSPYNSYPVAYVCWQCLYGSFDRALIGVSTDTTTGDDIRRGTSGIPSMTYGSQRYYEFKDSQVKDRL